MDFNCQKGKYIHFSSRRMYKFLIVMLMTLSRRMEYAKLIEFVCTCVCVCVNLLQDGCDWLNCTDVTERPGRLKCH